MPLLLVAITTKNVIQESSGNYTATFLVYGVHHSQRPSRSGGTHGAAGRPAQRQEPERGGFCHKLKQTN